jgi:hypothetical protein
MKMLTVQTAYTLEIDEIDDALDEILDQLDLTQLKTHTAGLLSCYYDFVESGVVGELCARLPFDVIGMTTIANATAGNAEMYALTLTVLTSDDVSFTAAITPPLTSDNYAFEVDKTYKNALGNAPEDPALIISYLPYISDVSGADLVKAFDKSAGEVPIFGSITFGIDVTYNECRSIFNGQVEQYGIVMLLMYGDVEPDFVSTALPQKNIRESRALITDSDGCILKGVNGMSPLEYLDSIGVILKPENSSTVAFLVYYDAVSEPVTLGVFNINDDGSLLCGGEMPMGAAVSIGSIDRDGILETAKISVEKLLANDRKNGLLMLPCVTRFVMLAPDQSEEMDIVADMVGDTIPYMFAYSGGEVCPVKDKDGKWANRFRNYTFSACVF